jgi:hypothetical protein
MLAGTSGSTGITAGSTGSAGGVIFLRAVFLGAAFLGAASEGVVFLVGILFSSFYIIFQRGKSITTYGFFGQTLRA